VNPYEFWWCCLRDADRFVMRGVAAPMLLTLGQGIPLSDYELLWMFSGGDGAAYRAAFEALYHLEIGTITLGDEEIEAMVPTEGFGPWWFGAGVWNINPDSACADGCEQSQRPQ